jgi:1-aminocyclopropane-1-carboxylate deaminase/D-cysteine desulfhydrase-like pyridoxal-dependent ACC family enzyme
MLTQALLELKPEIEKTWIPLINNPTPVYSLKRLGHALNHRHLYTKREDLTDLTYGGNKVRNLEFLLGDALSKKASRVVTAAPLGSNFVAALAAQSNRIGIPAEIYHFVPHLNRQIEKHARFSETQKAKLNIYNGPLFSAVLRAATKISFELSKDKSVYRMPTGGSGPLGVLGHINAVFELHEQVRAGLIPEPDFIVVGVGTCGTVAGLHAGLMLSGMKTKVVGVRCVDRVICNRFMITRLINQSLNLLGSKRKIRPRDIHLYDHGAVDYGRSLADATAFQNIAMESENIRLDTTYTTKVVSWMSQFLSRSEIRNKHVLYWHTFSDAAVREPANGKHESQNSVIAV